MDSDQLADEKPRIEPNSDLSALIADAIPLGPTARAKLLYDSPALEAAHSTAAQQGQTVAPGATDDIDLHYVCFVKSEKTNHLWELDGSRKGPLDRGLIGEGDDVLSEAALELGPRRFMKREEEVGNGELRFSLVCLAPNLD
jgi:ubiquitin carboxyl-terminal hydrolase L3